MGIFESDYPFKQMLLYLKRKNGYRNDLLFNKDSQPPVSEIKKRSNQKPDT